MPDREPRRGRVVAVCRSPRHGYPTYPRGRVTVAEDGIVGDAHSGSMRASFTNPGTQKPNDRPISIVAKEVMDDLNERFKMDVQPGDFNEQVLVEGMGDLSDVEIGDMVAFDSGVTLQVTDNAFPCTRLEAHNHHKLISELAGRRPDGTKFTKRGILARVVSTGDLTAGQEITITPQSKN